MSLQPNLVPISPTHARRTDEKAQAQQQARRRVENNSNEMEFSIFAIMLLTFIIVIVILARDDIALKGLKKVMMKMIDSGSSGPIDMKKLQKIKMLLTLHLVMTILVFVIMLVTSGAQYPIWNCLSFAVCLIVYTVLSYEYGEDVRSTDHVAIRIVRASLFEKIKPPEPLTEDDYQAISDATGYVMFLYDGARYCLYSLFIVTFITICSVALHLYLRRPVG